MRLWRVLGGGKPFRMCPRAGSPRRRAPPLRAGGAQKDSLPPPYSPHRSAARPQGGRGRSAVLLPGYPIRHGFRRCAVRCGNEGGARVCRRSGCGCDVSCKVGKRIYISAAVKPHTLPRLACLLTQERWGLSQRVLTTRTPNAPAAIFLSPALRNWDIWKSC